MCSSDLAYNNSFFSWPLLAGPGGFIFGRNAQGELDPTVLGVNDAGALQGAQMLDRLVKDGHMPRGARYSEMESAFAKGQVAMMINGPWAWDNVKKVGIDFAVAPIPSIAGKPGKPFVGVLGCMITAPSRLKDVAREFLEHHVLQLSGLKTISADVPLGTPATDGSTCKVAPGASVVVPAAASRRPITVCVPVNPCAARSCTLKSRPSARARVRAGKASVATSWMASRLGSSTSFQA